MLAAVTLIATGSALDASGILGARETLASGVDSGENISGAGSEARRVYGFSSSASGGIVSSVRHTGAQAGVSRVAGAESSDAGFGRTVIRGPVAEVARAGGNTPAASDSRRGCADNRRGLAYYYAALASWRLKMERELSARSRGTPAVDGQRASGLRDVPSSRVSRSCNWVRRAVQLVRSRAQKARRSYQAWHAAQWVLHEQRTWRAAVEHVQRVYPLTASWLMSCSAAEGGWGRWVGYGGQSYSTGLRDSDTVGGPMQFRFSTFTGMYRRSVEHVRSRGYRLVPLGTDLTAAWRSYLGQALAAGWARWSGNDNSHWSASWARGCR